MVVKYHLIGSAMPSERSTKSDVASQILATATRLFAARGFDGTSIQAVAEDVGIRKPSLLYHFPTKDDLRRAVLENLLVHWNEVLPRLLMAATSGPQQFDAVFRETISFFSEDPDRARLLLREALDRPAEMRALIRDHVRPWATVICDYIRKGQAAGRVRADVDPEAYLVHAINLVISSIATWNCIEALNPQASDNVDAARAEYGGRRAAFERHQRELFRVAKSSLFGAHRDERSQPAADDEAAQ